MFYRVPSADVSGRVSRLQIIALVILLLAVPLPHARARTQAAAFERDLDAASPVELRVKNRTGRVSVLAEEESKRVSIRASSAAGLSVTERDVRVTAAAGAIQIEREGAAARPSDGRKVTPSQAQVERERIDLTVRVPARSRVWVETEAGAVDVVGNVAEAEAKTDTGTIRADVPLDALRYSFRWTLSRPRLFSEVELPKVREKRGGVFEISGRFPDEKKEKGRKKEEAEPSEDDSGETAPDVSAAVETRPTPEPQDKDAAKKREEALKKAREEKAKAAK